MLMGLEKVMNVLGIRTLFFDKYLQFNSDIILAVLDPMLDVLFGIR